METNFRRGGDSERKVQTNLIYLIMFMGHFGHESQKWNFLSVEGTFLISVTRKDFFVCNDNDIYKDGRISYTLQLRNYLSSLHCPLVLTRAITREFY